MKTLFNLFSPHSCAPVDDLDKPLLWLSRQDPLRIRNFVEGTQIFGSSGSGKTSGSGQAIAKAFLRAGFGGLVMVAKNDERELWERYASETGREESLVIFSLQEKWRFNFLDYEFRRPGAGAGITQNLVALFSTVVEVAERGRSGAAQDFWERSLKTLLRNAIDLAALGKGRVSLDLLHDIVASAPSSPEEVGRRSWQERSVCMQCIREGEERRKTALQTHDFELTVKYWLKEFAGLAPKTRSIIVACFTNIADVFLRGQLHQLFCTDTNIVPEVTHDGAIVILDVPVKEYAEVGQLAQVLFKYIWQRSVERRDISKHPKPVFLWADESQLFVNSHDAVFQTTARSSRVCTVYLTQSLSNYYAALGGERSKPEVNSLLGNLATKIFHSNADAVTNHYAADLFAKNFNYRTTSGISTPDGDFRRGAVSHNIGGHESLENQVQPIEFSRLRKGGPENGYCVDAIVHQSGREWRATGRTFLRTTFKQR